MVGRLLVVVACATGCGRIDFTARGPDAGAPAADARGDAAAGAIELCNGIDDDGDGQVDEGCPCAAFAQSWNPVDDDVGLVWLGDRYAVLYADASNDYIATVDAGGLGAAAAIVPVGPGVEFPEWTRGIAWNGSEADVIWASPNGLELARYTFSGNAAPTKLGELAVATTAVAANYLRIVWAGDRFAVAWLGAGDSLVHLREVAAGGLLGTEQTYPALSTLTMMTGFAASADAYLIAGTDAGDAPYMLHVRRPSLAADSPVALTQLPDGFRLDIVAGPGGFGVVLADSAIEQAHFLSVGDDGTPAALAFVIPSSADGGFNEPTINATPDGYHIDGVSYGTGPTDHAIYYVVMAPDGGVLVAPTTYASFSASAYDFTGTVIAAGRTGTTYAYDGGAGLVMDLVQDCH